MSKGLHLLFFITGIMLTVFSGCASLDSSSQNNDDLCIGDYQCPEGYGCTSRGNCLPFVDPSEVPIGIEIYDQRTDSPTKGKLILDFGPDDLNIDGDGYVHLTIPEPVRISGTMKTAKSDVSVDAMLISYRLSNIPGRNIVSQTMSVGEVNYFGTQYEMDVVQRGYYYFQVIPQPSDKIAPILRFHHATDDSQMDFTLGEEKYVVTGRVNDAGGNPVSGAVVWGFDLETGASSTISEITSDASGLFSVSFTNIPTTLSLYIGPAEYSTRIPAVLFEYSDDDLRNQVQGNDGVIYFDCQTLEVPELPAPITFGTTIYGTSASGNREYINGATVTFKSVVGGGTRNNGVILAEGNTDSEGNITVELIPGDFDNVRIYEVSVTPPTDSNFSGITKVIEVGSLSGFGESIELLPQINAVGQVLSPENSEPLEQVLVEAYGKIESNLDDNVFQRSTRTDSNGWFSLNLDPGIYDFSLYFSDSYIYPYTTFEEEDISENATEMTPFLFVPPMPGIVKIILEDTSGNPIKDLEIRTYQVPVECLDDVDCEYEARLLHSSRTDSNGLASSLVPLWTL
ncbi:MAG: carboxypeptidase regulatory-like domain-containing protein [Deltaproteobacteria bacterium]|nr:carboxypeptidase regulatory-like domain-containing protein [Deltaproteobacteria bacterium]